MIVFIDLKSIFKPCHGCNAFGQLRCFGCNGIGRKVCENCEGSRNSYSMNSDGVFALHPCESCRGNLKFLINELLMNILH